MKIVGNCYWSRRWLHSWLFYIYFYFKENYKLIVKDLSQQQAVGADSKPVQQINFTGNLDHAENTAMLLIL